jgi:uncharacterized protein YlaN (UPF0358 family)
MIEKPEKALRPDLKTLTPDVRKYIEDLEKKVENLTEDSLSGWHNVLNMKLNELKKEVMEFKINLTDNDKGFERFWKAIVDSKDMVQSINFLRIESGQVKTKEKINPIEDYARRNRT